MTRIQPTNKRRRPRRRRKNRRKKRKKRQKKWKNPAAIIHPELYQELKLFQQRYWQQQKQPSFNYNRGQSY